MRFIDALFARLERLGVRVPRSLVTFICVGLMGLAVHTGVLSAVLHMGFSKPEAWFTGLAIATVVTWSLNRRFTFVSAGRRSGAEIGRYALVTLVAQGVSYAVFMAVTTFEPRLPPQIALFSGSIVGTLFSYTGQRFFTFAPIRAPA